jgi:hypothetical protein
MLRCRLLGGSLPVTGTAFLSEEVEKVKHGQSV